MLTFTIETRGGHYVAVSHGADPEFVMNKETLEKRTKNLSARGDNVDAESAALAEMHRRARDRIQPASTAATKCPYCGYDLTGTIYGECPGCGNT